jgi:hypothetical protein
MRKPEREALLTQSEGYRLALTRVDEHRDVFPPRARSLDYLGGKARHFELRAAMPTIRSFRKRASLVATEVKTEQYRRFSNGWVSVAKDLLLPDELFASRSRR